MKVISTVTAIIGSSLVLALPARAQTAGAELRTAARGAPVTKPVPGETLPANLNGLTGILARYPVVGPFELEVEGPDGAPGTIRVGSAFDGDVPS